MPDTNQKDPHQRYNDPVRLEREKNAGFLAKWSLIVLFPTIIASGLFGLLWDQPEAFALTGGLTGAAMLILRYYFPRKS